MSLTDLPAFLFAVALLVAIHEWGHYRVAKACGVKVLRFSVGFGRVLLRRTGRDGTEFTLSAIPLGGYVRMLDAQDGPIAPADEGRAFNQRPLLQRSAIVAAGPAANWVLAVLLFAAVAWLGSAQPTALLGTPPAGSLAERAGVRSGDLVRAVSADGQQWQDVVALPELLAAAARAQAMGEGLHLSVTDAQGHAPRSVRLDIERLAGRAPDARMLTEIGLAPHGEPLLSRVNPGGAGEAAGLQAGDRVLSVDGRAMPDAGALRNAIRNARDGEQARTMQWRIERAGQVIELNVTPEMADSTGQRMPLLKIGVGSPPERVAVSYGFFEGLGRGVTQTWELAVTTLRLLGRILTGEASVKNLSGPITMADYAGQSARAGVAPFLDYLAKISLSLAVLNLLPLPMLDGGHLLYHLFEGLTGRPVPERWQLQLQRAGALILVLMMALAFSNDIARLAGWH